MAETLVAYGGAIKALGEGKLGGYLVVYGDEASPDLEGDFFTAATDFGFDDGAEVGLYYMHGLDPALGKRRVGKAHLRRDPLGIWIEAQLALRDEYERAIYGLAVADKLGWSSGAAAHLVERGALRTAGGATDSMNAATPITRWAIAEASLTPTPAEPRACVMPVKTLTETPLRVSVADAHTQTPTNKEQRNNDMPTMEMISEQLAQVLRYMEDAPAIKGAGYFSMDGGAADAQIKSLGDWLLAVMRGDDVRLRSIYKSTKALGVETGSAGGYTVPTEYSAQLLQIATAQSPVLARVRRIPVNAPVGEYPALDQYLAPTAGSGETALAAGTKAKPRAEGAAYNETQPDFEMIRYRLHDSAAGMVKVSRELRADSAAGVEAFLRNVIGVSVASKLEYQILRGTGVGEPLGILNSPALIGITPDTNNTFAYADAVEMVARFKAVAGTPVWIYHPGMINDIALFQIGTGGAAFVNSMSASTPLSLLGYPLVSSEHLPQPDNSGCAVLVDLGAYLLFEKGGLYIEFSEHAAFTEGKDIWRFGIRCDGQPWMKSAITLADPQGGYTVSPFVSFND
jgi:HK97 family phage major capsid protein